MLSSGGSSASELPDSDSVFGINSGADSDAGIDSALKAEVRESPCDLHVASLDPNAYSYKDAEANSVSKPILVSESIPMSKPILIPEPIPEPILIPELILIPEPNPIPKPILESIPETDTGPTIWNRFQKTSELAGITRDQG